MLLTFDLIVTHEDGTTTAVTADQRDLAAWEMQSFGCSAVEGLQTKAMAMFRFLAWSAMRRRKLTDLSWQDWTDATPEVESGEAEVPDPGSPAAPVAG